MGGVDRPWHVGILHDGGDNRFARAMLTALADDPALNVGNNEPYSMNTIDLTIPSHAYPRALPYVEIEIRQDLLADAAGIDEWSARLERALIAAHGSFRSLPSNATRERTASSSFTRHKATIHSFRRCVESLIAHAKRAPRRAPSPVRLRVNGPETVNALRCCRLRPRRCEHGVRLVFALCANRVGGVVGRVVEGNARNIVRIRLDVVGHILGIGLDVVSGLLLGRAVARRQRGDFKRYGESGGKLHVRFSPV